MKIYDSWSRFDESRQFIGVFHQANRPVTDADLNEEVRIRATDVWRRTADLAEGSPDGGFQISDTHLIDAISGTAGWVGQPLPPDDLRVVTREMVLDRREPAGLPFVLRSRGHLALRRTLPAGELDLVDLVPGAPGLPHYAAAALVVAVRFEVPSNDQDAPDVRFLAVGPAGEVALPAGLGPVLPAAWTEIRIPTADLQAAGITRLRGWGLSGLPPRARVFVDSLRAEVAGLGRNDFVIRGGDGTLTGAGRMLAQGQRALIRSDHRYAFQPDFPQAPPLLNLIPGGPPSSGTPPEDGHFLVSLLVTHGTVTAGDDDFLIEPALDGLDTAARQRVVTQVRATWVGPGATEVLPAPTGGGTLTTFFQETDSRPRRYPAAPTDPCRDRCLFTESIATGRGYRGTDNINIRVEIFRLADRPVVLLSRDNASTVLPLVASAPSGATTLKVPPAEAGRLQAGDLVVLEDRVTRLQPEGPQLPALRRLRSVDVATGTLELEPTGATTGLDTDPLPVGGPLDAPFAVENRAAVRRWDAADWLAVGSRYNFPDGVEFALGGASADFRTADYWTFIARIHDPDGQARGVLERLVDAPVHGPIQYVVPLARIRERAGKRVFEDIRPRFLPLGQVRDRLRELERDDQRGTFTIVVGDGTFTHGDIDQDTVQGVTGDEAIQDAIQRLGASGGTVFVRAGNYVFERPVLMRGVSRLRIVGEGDATTIQSVGAGGAFVLDNCGADGQVTFERLRIIEDPQQATVIGGGGGPVPPEPAEAPLTPDDLREPAATPATGTALSDRLKVLRPGEGRAMTSLLATLDRLRRIQKLNQGRPLETIPEAQPLLAVLRRLPHGVITIADSQAVEVLACQLRSTEPLPLAAGVLVTGVCRQIEIARNRIEAASGVAALPLATFLSERFLVRAPLAGLQIERLGIAGNRFRGTGQAVHGVHVADGILDGVEIRNNLVEGYAVGIAIEDKVERRAQVSADRIVVSDNRIIGSRVIAVQIAGDGVDVASNEIRNAATENLLNSSGLFHAAVQVVGQGVRVRDCWIVLPTMGNAPVLGLCAAVVIGDGMVDGSSDARGVFDIEIADNRIEGSGAGTPAAGVVLGGPQPVYDVRVRGNVIRNLGNSAIRVLGSTVAVGRLRIEENRIEQVALAEVAAEDLDVRAQLQRLGDDLPGGIETISRPQPLLEALLAQAGRRNRGALDAVLRWIEALTLRGAVVLNRLTEGEVSGNRIAGVGRFQSLAEPRPLGAEVRTAGVAIVGGRDMVVSGNHIEEVRAPAVARTPPSVVGAGGVPPAFDALAALTLAAPASSAPSSSGPVKLAVDAGDLHAAVAGAHRLLLTYTRETTNRHVIGRRLYGALDGLIRGIVAQPGPNAELGSSLERLTALMRSTQNEQRHTEVASAIRAVLAHIGRVTAANQTATNAWRAIEDLEGAIAGANAAAKTREVAARLQADATLVAGVPEVRQRAIQAALGALAAGTGDPLVTVDQLTWVAALRDEEARRSKIVTQPLGSRKEIAQSLAGGLKSTVGSLRTAADPQPILARMRGQMRALSKTLRESGSELDAFVESDFRALDRVQVPREGEEIDRFIETLDRVVAVSRAGATPGTNLPSESDAEASVRLARTRGETSLRVLVIDQADEQVTRLQALAQVSDALVDAGLGVLQATLFQIQGLVEDDAELRPLSAAALVALREAIAASGAARLAKLATVRERLQKLADPARQQAGAAAADSPPPSVRQTAETPRRLAGLGALLLAFEGLRQQTRDVRSRALDLFTSHLARALAETNQGSSATQAALDGLKAASPVLLGEFEASSPTSAEEQTRLAIFNLASVLDLMASDAVDEDDHPTLLAAAALLAAVKTAFQSADPGRLQVMRDLLAARKADVSAAVVDHIVQQAELPRALAAVRRALERLARGEAPTTAIAPEPEFETEPDPADGVFAAAVDGRFEVSGNKIETALIGVAIVGSDRHVLAEPPPAQASTSTLLVDASDNRVHGCALAALDVAPGSSATIRVAGNQALACGDLGAREAAAATAAPTGMGTAVARFLGTGELLISGNTFHGNGHGHPAALLHEVLVDWRGDVVVRGNTIRHRGGGAGGAGLLLVLETLPGTPADGARLVKHLAQAPALAVEPPPRPQPKPPIIRAPSRALLNLDFPVTGVVASSHYLDRARVAPAASRLIDRLIELPIFRLPPRPLPARRSAHIEGNQVVSAGPALLALAAGDSVVSVAVVGNELRTMGATGAVYLRRTDATVFTGNHCECLATVNVVVMRPDAAPVTATGNVILGQQPVAQVDPLVINRRLELKGLLQQEIVKALDLTAGEAVTEPATPAPPPPPVPAPAVPVTPASPAEGGAERFLFTAERFRFVRPSDLKLNLFKGLPTGPAPTPPPGQPPPPPPKPVQDPGAFSLVIIGGTRVVAAGNATSAGALTLDADQQSELNV